MIDKKYIYEKRALQLTIFIAAIVPICAGFGGIFLGSSLFGDMSSVSLESHFKYLSGLLFAIGLIFWSLIPKIEDKTKIVRILTLIVFMSGLSRLYSAIFVSPPTDEILFALCLELIITPLICLWQNRISKLII